MAFESLSDKLQNIFKNLRRKGRLTEADVKAALREVRLALLEADVSFKVVKSFMKSVQEKAIGADVMKPRSCTWERERMYPASDGSSSGVTPNLVVSPATFTSIRTGMIRPAFAASFSMVSARARLSTEWISATNGAMYLTLLR